MNPDSIMIRNLMMDETDIAVMFIRKMVSEIESFGGYAVTEDEDDWQRISNSISEKIQDKTAIYLLAEHPDMPTEPIGFLEARIITLSGAFKADKNLHISSIYVDSRYRRNGIATRLLANVLATGKQLGCSHADLNVLKENPSQQLYKEFGFTSFQINMRKRLSALSKDV